MLVGGGDDESSVELGVHARPPSVERATNRVVILAVGEALVDLVIAPDGTVEAALGGAPYNTARAAGRLGAEVEFVGGLSTDRFGSLLRQQLADDGVGTGLAEATTEPTTLAAAEIDDTGAAEYRFYFHSTSAPKVQPETVQHAVRKLGAGDIVFTGGLALVLQPMADAVVEGLEAIDDDVLVVVDVNCRAAVVPDRDAYVDRVHTVAARADVIKVSDEDLDYLTPSLGTNEAAQALLERGPQAVVVTAGASHTVIVTASGQALVDVPAIAAPIVDTVGAGDTFGAGMLASIGAAGASRRELSMASLQAAVRVGHAAAGIVVTRRGADPPYRSELDVEWP